MIQAPKATDNPSIFSKECLRFFTKFLKAVFKYVCSMTPGLFYSQTCLPAGRLFTLLFYSVLSDFTGFARAAFIAWKLIVINAITAARIPAAKNIHHGIDIR